MNQKSYGLAIRKIFVLHTFDFQGVATKFLFIFPCNSKKYWTQKKNEGMSIRAYSEKQLLDPVYIGPIH